jgi:DNA replication protein DnaC
MRPVAADALEIDRRIAADELYSWHVDTGVPRRLRTARFVDSRSTVALEAGRTWLREQPDGPGCLIFTGTTGTGKTWASACIARECYDQRTAAREAERQDPTGRARWPWAARVASGFRFLTAPDWVRQALNFREQADAWDTVDRAGILLLDDLGAGADDARYWGVIEELVCQREAEGARLIATSNLEPARLAEALGDRVMDRLRAWGRIVACPGESLRVPRP